MSAPQLFGLACVELIGDFALKTYANDGGLGYLGLGILGYIGVVSLLIVALQGSTLLVVNNGWDGMSSLIESFLAYVVLGERFDNYMQYVGLFMVVLGMYFLKLPWEKKSAFRIPKV